MKKAKVKAQRSEKLKPIVVTTIHKGVFFGYGKPKIAETMTLKNARMCVYWCQEVKGVVGLSVTGPLPGCRISNPSPEITVNGVTSVMRCKPEAVAAWESGLWS